MSRPTSSAKKALPPRKRRRTTTNSTRTTKPRKRSETKKRSSDPRPVWLGLGSNLGDRGGHLEAAIREVSGIASVRRVSSVYVSEPVGYADQRDFWNAAAEISWRGSPRDLLRALKDIEVRLGRRPTFPNGPRAIDIDILDFDGLVSAGSDPILPHPRLAGRRFALAPLDEIAPDWRHPILHRTASQLIARLPARPSARRLPRMELWKLRARANR